MHSLINLGFMQLTGEYLVNGVDGWGQASVHAEDLTVYERC